MKKSKRHVKSRHKVPEATGQPISHEELLRRSRLPEEEFDYCVEHHLIPGAVRTSGKGSGRAGAHFTWREGHVPYCTLIQQIRSAGGSYAQAALRLMLERLPFTHYPESDEWLRKAMLSYVTTRYDAGLSIGELRKQSQRPHLTAARSVTRRAQVPIGLPNSALRDRDLDALGRGQGITWKYACCTKQACSLCP